MTRDTLWRCSRCDRLLPAPQRPTAVPRPDCGAWPAARPSATRAAGSALMSSSVSAGVTRAARSVAPTNAEGDTGLASPVVSTAPRSGGSPGRAPPRSPPAGPPSGAPRRHKTLSPHARTVPRQITAPQQHSPHQLSTPGRHSLARSARHSGGRLRVVRFTDNARPSLACSHQLSAPLCSGGRLGVDLLTTSGHHSLTSSARQSGGPRTSSARHCAVAADSELSHLLTTPGHHSLTSSARRSS
jgi:hypothetical protein